MTQASLQFAGTMKLRQTKRQQIEAWFAEHPGIRLSTRDCHARWGTAFRTRVSEINRSQFASVTIHNHTGRVGNIEESYYWGTTR